MQVAIEDEQALSRYLSHARAGEDVVLTERGRVVGRIVAAAVAPSPLPATPLQGKEREEAFTQLMRLLDKGISLGGVPPTRDEMHER